MNLWVKKNNILCKNITKRWTRARTGRRTEIKQHEMGRDRARRCPKKRGQFFTTIQSGHLLYHSEANNGQAGIGFPVKKMERQHNKSILWEFQSSRTSRTRNRQIPTEDRSSICANDISLRWRDRHLLQHHWQDPGKAKTLHNCDGEPNAKVGGQTNTSERVTECFGLVQRNERGDELLFNFI